MNKLYAIRNNKTDKQYGKDFFEKKNEAKVVRDELNENSKNKFSIMLGPDHSLYKENKNGD